MKELKTLVGTLAPHELGGLKMYLEGRCYWLERAIADHELAGRSNMARFDAEQVAVFKKLSEALSYGGGK